MLKLLDVRLGAAPDLAARLRGEAALLRRLRHPGAAGLIGAGTTADGRLYLCSELLEGEVLTGVIARDGPLAGAQALAVLEPLCAALAVAHALGVIHLDIQPANVMVCRAAAGERPRVALQGFGAGRLAEVFAAELAAARQRLGAPCLVPGYSAGLPADARADVYGLGALAFFLMTGRVPFEDASLIRTQYNHRHARRPRVSVAAPVSIRLDAVIARAMAIDPDDRYPDPLALLAALRVAVRASAPIAAV